MRKIELSQGEFALVDDNDYEWLSKYHWCAKYDDCTKGYYAIRGEYIEGKHTTIMMHREIMGCRKGEFIDHINRNSLDNQRKNLRFVSRSLNQANRPKPSNNTSGHKGVGWEKSRNKWRAKIRVNQKLIHLGFYTDPKEAALAYNRAASFYFGEYALLNVV